MITSVFVHPYHWYQLNGGDTSVITTKANNFAQWCLDCQIGKSNEHPVIINFSYDIADTSTQSQNEKSTAIIVRNALISKGIKYGVSVGSFDGGTYSGTFYDNTSNFATAIARIENNIDYFYWDGYFSAGTDNIFYLSDIFWAEWFVTETTRINSGVRVYLKDCINAIYAKKGTSGTLHLFVGQGLSPTNDYSFSTTTFNTYFGNFLTYIYSYAGMGTKNMKLFIFTSDHVGSDSTWATEPGGANYSAMIAKLSAINTRITTHATAKNKVFPRVNAEQWRNTSGTLSYAPFSRIKDQIDNEKTYCYQEGVGPCWVLGQWQSSTYDDSTFRTDYKAFYFGSPLTETITGPASAPTGNQTPSQGSTYAYTSAAATSSQSHSLSYQFDWKGDGSDLSAWGEVSQSKTWTSTGSFSVKSRARCTSHPDIVGSWTSGLSVTVGGVALTNYAWSTNLVSWTLESKSPRYKVEQVPASFGDWSRVQTQILQEDPYSSDHLVGNINGSNQITYPSSKSTLLDSYHNYYISGSSTYIPMNIKGSIYDSALLDGIEGIYIYGDYLYAQARMRGILTIISISNPLYPSIVGSVTDATLMASCEGIQVLPIGSTLYAFNACYDSDRMVVVNVQSPASPIITSSVTSSDLDGPTWVNVLGSYCFTTSYGHANYNTLSRAIEGHITTIDVTTIGSPTQVADLADMRLAGAETTILSGSYLYVACAYGSVGGGSVTIVNISDPLNPVIAGTYGSPALGGCEGIAVSGNYAYATAYATDSLTILDISNPAAPSYVGSVADATYLNQAHEVIVIGNYAYVASQLYDGVTVVDVSTPAVPVIVDRVADTQMNHAVRILNKGSYLYVSAYSADRVVVLGG